MTGEDIAILQNFSALWERVCGSQSAAQAVQDPRLEILELLYKACQGYGDMAKSACGVPRRRLLCMQREAAGMIRHLQTGLFLESGDTYEPARDGAICKFCAGDLQKLWKNTTALCRACAHVQVQGEGITESDLQAVERMGQCHRQALRQILQELL